MKKAALLGAGMGVAGGFPASIQKAFGIDPTPGSTFLDAEHVVILMQENRSFDHALGALRGVRGFNDPRAVALPNGNPVWCQSNRAGETYAPFRLNLHDTRATWLGSLPHSWVDQTDARNDGRHDGWLDAKPSGRPEGAHLPLTLGYYNREDLPFYYALADAFTVCDQNFCSSLTGTTPNRLHLWTGTIRERPSQQAKACVRNEDVDYGAEANWTTFPERLEDHGISWRVYQNEVSLDTGLEHEAEGWLANFTDNPLEWFIQFRVRHSAAHRRHLTAREKALAAELTELERNAGKSAAAAVATAVRKMNGELEQIRQELALWSATTFEQLSPRERNLHEKAFTTNAGDPHYRELATIKYRDGFSKREMQVPRGDVFHQFRADVRSGKLPAVSWIVAPENFSDHPGAPWYGAWYVSEALDILTQNPEVWRKTIFILCYDENDGYFDHVPPFVPPHPDRPETGKVSTGLDTSVEHVRIEQEQERQGQNPGAAGRAGPIGLGFRVPLVIASPWSRGGWVNSEVCDHTSILQLLETILSHRTGKSIRETNISEWRRTICGNLSSVFRPYRGEKLELPKPVERESFLGTIHQAQFKPIPQGFRPLGAREIAQAVADPAGTSWLPRQEKGIRPACALPYELSVEGSLEPERKSFLIHFAAGRELFGPTSAGAPFHAYAPGKMRVAGGERGRLEAGRTWAYAVKAGDRIQDSWNLEDFADGVYHLRVHGPNGFYREFRGAADDPGVDITTELARTGGTPTGDLVVRLFSRDTRRPWVVLIEDVSYGGKIRRIPLAASSDLPAQARVDLALGRSHGWYDIRIRVEGSPRFERRHAGHVEIGHDSFSDPLMGRVNG